MDRSSIIQINLHLPQVITLKDAVHLSSSLSLAGEGLGQVCPIELSVMVVIGTVHFRRLIWCLDYIAIRLLEKLPNNE